MTTTEASRLVTNPTVRDPSTGAFAPQLLFDYNSASSSVSPVYLKFETAGSPVRSFGVWIDGTFCDA